MSDFLPCDDCDRPVTCARNPARCAWSRRTRAEKAKAEALKAQAIAKPAADPLPGERGRWTGDRGYLQPVSPVIALTKGHWGHKLWADLHRRPIIYAGDQMAELAWLERFRAGIPNGCSCKCRESWTAMVEANPPDLTDGPSLARWGFRMHNLVNRSIGKSDLSWEAARDLWDWTDNIP